MKYRLPGVYLGNISLDLFMEYMRDEDLSNQITTNDYYQTNNRTENTKVFRVDFTYNSIDYNFYTYDILNTTNIREIIRTYFRDIISPDPDYDANVDSIIFTVQPTIFIENPILFDTLGQPSIYSTYMINNTGEHNYMISIKGASGEDLNNYLNMKQYVDNSILTEIPVNIYDLRYSAETLVKTLYIDIETLNESSINLMERDVNEEIIKIRDNIVYFGNKSLLNYIGSDGSFYFKDRLGGLTKSPYKNVMMWDIQNNRNILDQSIQMKMLSPSNSVNFSGIAGAIRVQKEDNDKIDLILSKYDKYSLSKSFKKIASIPPESEDIRFEDIEPKTIDLVDNAMNQTYQFDNINNMVIYTDLVNTSTLPKFKAIYKLSDDGNKKYYIFDTANGEVPEFRNTEGDSDPKTLCLLDVYNNVGINVNSYSSNKSHNLDYNIHYDATRNEYFIFRTVVFGGRTHYVKLADNENELTGYIIITSNTTNSFNTAKDLINDFSFADMGLTINENDVYPVLYEKDISGAPIVTKWGIDIKMTSEEKFSTEFKKIEDGSTEAFSTFMDESTLNGKLYFKFPIRININSESVEKIEDVMVTLRAKRLISANDYEFETFGYLATSDSGNYSITPPVFSDYNTEETKPYNNISSYLSINSFIWDALNENYSKQYYVINKYNQSNVYEITETLSHEDSPLNLYPYNNTFYKINRKLSSIINNNDINSFNIRLGTSITEDDRGEIISSDIMGSDLIVSLKDEFRRGFNNIFYGIGNYTYNYTLAELDDKQKLKFIQDSLVNFDSLNKMLTSFLRYNFVSTNDYLYTIDSNFRMGFFIKKEDRNISGDRLFTNWISAVPIEETNPDSLNTLQKIKQYEKVTLDEDIISREKINWIKNHLLYNGDGNTTTGYITNRQNKTALKDINNKEIVDQAFSMLMDQRYNVTKVINSFNNTNISNLIILNSKEKDLFSGSHEQVRFINSNQKIDVMVNSYLSGFIKKVGE